MNKLTHLFYRLKAEVCRALQLEPETFDPETDDYYIVQEWGGKSFDGEITSYWFERFVVSKGFRNWWAVFYGDSG